VLGPPDGVEVPTLPAAVLLVVSRIRFVKAAPLFFFLFLLGGGMFSWEGVSSGGGKKSLLRNVIGWYTMRTVVPNGL
jgi:hypothetical protein